MWSRYYFYKQLSIAGQAGTAVVRTASDNTDVKLLGFKGGSSRPTFGTPARRLSHPDAFVVINGGAGVAQLRVRLFGTDAREWNVTRTSDAGEEGALLPIITVAGDLLLYDAPAFSATTSQRKWGRKAALGAHNT